jgi:hypothetical protein
MSRTGVGVEKLAHWRESWAIFLRGSNALGRTTGVVAAKTPLQRARKPLKVEAGFGLSLSGKIRRFRPSVRLFRYLRAAEFANCAAEISQGILTASTEILASGSAKELVVSLNKLLHEFVHFHEGGTAPLVQRRTHKVLPYVDLGIEPNGKGRPYGRTPIRVGKSDPRRVRRQIHRGMRVILRLILIGH